MKNTLKIREIEENKRKIIERKNKIIKQAIEMKPESQKTHKNLFN